MNEVTGINRIINIPLEEILFFDIETTSQFPSYHAISDLNHRALWEHYWQRHGKPYFRLSRSWWHKILTRLSPKWVKKMELQAIAQSYQQQAALIPEFGQIICIGLGYFLNKEEKEKRDLEPDKLYFRTKGHMIHLGNISDEKTLLLEIQQFFNGSFFNPQNPRFKYLAGHNIKNFDIPYLCKRMVLHQLTPLPPILNIQDKPNWQTSAIIDTLELWQFGNYRAPRVSLEFLTRLFQIPSPKEEMDGSLVGVYYWNAIQQNKREFLEKIYAYCLQDVVAIANLILQWQNKPPLEPEQITMLPPEGKEDKQEN